MSISADEGSGNGDDNSEVMRLLAVSIMDRQIGLASYDELTNTIRADGFDTSFDDIEGMLVAAKMVCQPTLILVHPRVVVNTPLLEMVTCGIDGTPDHYSYQAMKTSQWNFDIALELMCTKLSVRDRRGDVDLETLSYQQNFLRLSAYLDLKNKPMVQSMGALLHYMRAFIFYLDNGTVSVNGIEGFTLGSYLRMDPGTSQSLQIFRTDFHPNVVKGTGRSKEGFSVFGLLDRTSSLPGRRRLRDWLMLPYCDKSLITERQDGVEMAARSENIDFMGAVVKLLKHIHDVPRLLLRIKKVTASYKEWNKIYMTLEAALPILDHCELFIQQSFRNSKDIAYIESLLANCNTQVIRNLFHSLTTAVDFDFSPTSRTSDNGTNDDSGGVRIREGYSAELDRLRYIYDKLDDALISTAKRVLEDAPLLQHVAVEYVPQIGYLIAIDSSDQHFLQAVSVTGGDRYDHDSQNHYRLSSGVAEGRRSVRETSSNSHGNRDVLDDNRSDGYRDGNRRVDTPYSNGYQYVYSNDGKLYFKHPYVLEMDDSIGDIKSTILDKQRSLVLDIEDELLACEFHLIRLSRFLESLDATISLGVIANEMACTRPDIVDDAVVIIKGGRHPLQELNVDVFVPNDTFLSAEKNIGIITGTNGSGKSVYLKQVGLLVYLAHVGCFLPCERAIIGLTDRILTRVASVETIANPLSSFALDLNQISRMLSLYTPRSLCLIDEFGKGTAPVDGMALLAAVIENFVRKPARTLIVMHFHEVLHKEIVDLDSCSCITAFKMDVHQERLGNARQDGRTVDGGCGKEEEEGFLGRDNDDDDDRGMREVPLYRLKLGVARESSGIDCALACGVPAAVVARAREISTVCLSPSLALRSIDRRQYLSTICSGHTTAGGGGGVSHGSEGGHRSGELLLTDSEVDQKKGIALLACFLKEGGAWENSTDEALGRFRAILANCR